MFHDVLIEIVTAGRVRGLAGLAPVCSVLA
jgi:hypothetical protein